MTGGEFLIAFGLGWIAGGFFSIAYRWYLDRAKQRRDEGW